MTDRVTLTDEERRTLRCKCVRLDNEWHHVRFCPVPAVESIVAAREAKAAAKALRDAAKRIYNGAGDPEQAFYDYGLHPWLTDLANKYDLQESA